MTRKLIQCKQHADNIFLVTTLKICMFRVTLTYDITTADISVKVFEKFHKMLQNYSVIIFAYI